MEGWSALAEFLQESDELADVKVEVGGRTFLIDALRLKSYVQTRVTQRLVGRSLCSQCRTQQPETTGFSVSANGSCAVSLCDPYLRALLDRRPVEREKGRRLRSDIQHRSPAEDLTPKILSRALRIDWKGLLVFLYRGDDEKAVVDIVGPEGEDTADGSSDMRVWMNDALIYSEGKVGDDLAEHE